MPLPPTSKQEIRRHLRRLYLRRSAIDRLIHSLEFYSRTEWPAAAPGRNAAEPVPRQQLGQMQ
ncbi:MAG: hypothetical protein HY235_28865 [Acidobacteria bacterium]|nr:hypothetical protein [Acidobacteriota bacterium]